MNTDTEFKLDSIGNQEPEAETQEQLEAVHKRLSQLSRGNGSLVTLSKQELSLLQKMLSTGTEEYRESQMWRMCSFLDEEEALDHIAAYYEAKELGMDTTFNISYAFALCSANRKNNFSSNLMSLLTDTLQNGKWANAEKRNKKDDNPRSPIQGM